MKTWVIGSDPACDVVVDQPTVSRRHCRLTREDDGYYLEDLASANGTFVNGRQIVTRTRVSPWDAVRLGQNVPLPWPNDGAAPAGRPARPPAPPSPAPAPSPSREREVIRIGRDLDNDVVLDLPTVSGHHARIVREAGGGLVIEDLGSANGTAVGSPDRKCARAEMSASDIVYFGSHPVPASRLLAGRAGAKGEPLLILRGSSMVVGRDPECDHVIEAPMVSSRHAQLVRKGATVWVEDLGSANGTFVNGQRIDRPTPVAPGDVIGLGSYLVRLAAGPSAAEAPSEPPILVPLPPARREAVVAGAASSRYPLWSVAALPAQIPWLAGAIVLAYRARALAPPTAATWPDSARAISAALSWLALAAVWVGLVHPITEAAARWVLRRGARGQPDPAGVAARIAGFCVLCGLQCVLLLAIVHWGLGLSGPKLPMLGVLALASASGVALGAAIVAAAGRPTFILMALAVVMLVMSVPGIRPMAAFLPARWAFEGLLLLEAPGHPTREEVADPTAAPPVLHDIAEDDFPAESERMGMSAAVTALGAMLVGWAAMAVVIAGDRAKKPFS